MRVLPALVLVAAAIPALARADSSHSPADCAPAGASGSRCLYRSILPSMGIVAICRDDRDCRVGYYESGDPAAATWLTPSPSLRTLPKPEVTWPMATLAQIRFDCGRACSVSYFLEIRRRRLSAPRASVLAVDPRRLLLAAAEESALVVRQIFSGK